MVASSLPDELRTVLHDYSKETDAICNSFSRELANSPVPPIIYHYTDDHGLKGILETGSLWFTDLFKLNDPSELSHGINIALNVLRSEADSGPSEVKDFYNQFARRLVGNLEMTAHYFVCCFSTTSDDLGQWRAYADDGRGYSIGFDAGALETAFAKSLGSSAYVNSTFPVSYDDARLRVIHKGLLAHTNPVISALIGMGLNAEVNSDFVQRLSIQLAKSFVMTALFFKHSAYINEEEYRFVQIFPADNPVPDLRIRTRPYSLVKYIDFDWKGVAVESLKEIVCGPAGDPKTSGEFAYDCLREYLPAMGIVSITRSEIPYRSVGP